MHAGQSCARILLMKASSFLFALSLGVLAMATYAIAEEPPESKPAEKPDQFKLADADGNGKLSKEEFTNKMMADFKSLDKDGSGSLSGDEVGKDPSPAVLAMDKDKDATISKEEFVAAVAALFIELDTNQDKEVTKGEIYVGNLSGKGSGPSGSGPAPKAPKAPPAKEE